MPQPLLPTEIIENVVEKLAEGPRQSCIRALLACSVASRAFLQPSQQRIFRDVTLASPPISRISRSNLVVHPETYSMFKRTLLFVDVVTRDARLGAYVENLTYELTSVPHYSTEKDRRDRNYVVGSFSLLPNVNAFTLGVHDPEEDSSLAISLSDVFTERAILAVVRRQQVQSLTLRFISDFDITFLHEAMNSVTTLALHGCALAGMWSDDDDNMDSIMDLHRRKSRSFSECPCLKHLACDAYSLKRCINVYLGLQRERKGVSAALGSLSHLEQLDLTVLDESDEDVRLPLLNHAATLTGLAVTRISGNLARIWDRNILLLKHIDPSSLHTITTLALNTIIHLEDEANLSGSDSSDSADDASRSELHDVTSASALGATLPLLAALQSLQLTVVLQGDLPLGVDQDHFLGPQWGKLSCTLYALCISLDLQAVSILVHIRALDYVSGGTYLEDARELQRGFVERVYPAQFLELEKLQKEGSIAFSFKVEVSVGGSVDEYTGQHSLFV